MRTTTSRISCHACPARIELTIHAVQYFGDEGKRYVDKIAEHQGWTIGERPGCPVHKGAA